MAGLPIQDQANAIWKALDKMLETDPEGYKRYIKEQMEEAKNFRPKQGAKPNGPEKSTGGQGSSLPGNSPLALGLDMLLDNLGILGLDSLGTDSKKSGGKEGQETPLKKLDVKKPEADKRKPKEDSSSAGDNASATNLLDDHIGNSVIASIVTDKSSLKKGGSQERDGDGPHLVGIKLPSNMNSNTKEDPQKKGKPLIEEL